MLLDIKTAIEFPIDNIAVVYCYKCTNYPSLIQTNVVNDK